MREPGPSWSRSAILSYGFALLSVGVTFAGVSLVQYTLQAAPPVSLFLCAIIFVAWFAGLGPALLTTALSVLSFGYFFLLPLDTFVVAPKDLPRIILFGIVSLFVASVTAKQRGTAASLRRTRDQLQEAVQDLETLNRQLLLENAERKAAEQRTRAAEQELQATVDMIPVLVARYGSDGTIEFVNRTWQEYSGVSLENVIGRPRSVVVHPDDVPMFEDAWRTHMAAGEPFALEQRARRADGQYRRHWVQRVPLRNEQGEIVKWYGVGLDIHDQKQAEDALRRSEAELAEARRELQLTIDSIPVLVAGYRHDGSHDFINKTLRDYAGISLETLKGDPWKSVMHPDDIESAKRQWRTARERNEPFLAEARLRRIDGE